MRLAVVPALLGAVHISATASTTTAPLLVPGNTSYPLFAIANQRNASAWTSADVNTVAHSFALADGVPADPELLRKLDNAHEMANQTFLKKNLKQAIDLYTKAAKLCKEYGDAPRESKLIGAPRPLAFCCRYCTDCDLLFLRTTTVADWLLL